MVKLNMLTISQTSKQPPDIQTAIRHLALSDKKMLYVQHSCIKVFTHLYSTIKGEHTH